jgi:hypothetical protein
VKKYGADCPEVKYHRLLNSNVTNEFLSTIHQRIGATI